MKPNAVKCTLCKTLQKADLAEDLVVDEEKYGYIESFYYLGDSWMKFRELWPILTSRALDVGLKFERAEMQMIRWMCVVYMKDRKTRKN